MLPTKLPRLGVSFARLALVLGLFATSSAETPASVSLTHSELTAEQASAELRQSWTEFLTQTPATPAARALALTEAQMPEPQRTSLALSSTVSFQEPEEVWSVDGTLSVTLVGMKTHNRIGDDPVYLRSYNGKLVGPTLRARPGDTLRVTLKNDFAPEPIQPGEMNTLHGFNVMNLHTHGLHVSPAGISDNVLLEVAPQSTQEYEIVIPRDHPAGTFWYHTHRHGSTAAQVSSGMAGVIIITGGMDNVPEIAKARERVIVFQQIAYLYKNCFTPKDAAGKPTGPTVCYDLPYGVIEQEYENRIFPPGSWEALGRFTTINGIKLPVFRVRPGAVERWRFVHAGVRESIRARLERAPTAGSSIPETIPLNEIAVDGLSLGKIAPRTEIELWPGYRSDVLVQFPNISAGEYLLVDEASPAERSLDGIAESRKYLARVIVEGAPEPMALPSSAQLASFRLPSIPVDTKNMNPQAVTYGIIVKNNVTTFNINGQPFGMDHARELTLGQVDDWTLKSENVINGVPRAISHPHHIHVNPFEVYSIKDDKGIEQLTEPVWHDTIIVHGGWTVKARSRNEVFTGLFVQHCHILDHEDQGMMELVEIKPPVGKEQSAANRTAAENPWLRVQQPFAAPALALPDSTGELRSLAEFRGRPTVLFFFKGAGCPHCTEQVALFALRAAEFRRAGINLVGVTSDAADMLAAAQQNTPTPFLIVSDAADRAFRDYGCFSGEPLHGAFVLDAAGAVRWKTIGAAPFMAVDTLLAEAVRLQTNPIPVAAVTAALP
jgi:FtsP/CotA-like multicopper oxidase with cupredoxin domain/peroxiredoxin